jgi:hypothetical protein
MKLTPTFPSIQSGNLAFITGALIAALSPPALAQSADTQARPAPQVFEFPAGVGRLTLSDAPCTDERILRHYGNNVPAGFQTGLLELRGNAINGCWYSADGRVFFTDSELDLLIPPPALEWFNALAGSQT